jgi:transposase
LSWPLPSDLDDAVLEAKLYPADSSERNKAAPDLKHVHRELRRKGVTLELLWQEYRALHPDGYGYSRFCDLYRDFRKGLDVVMRQSHTPGEKLFVDFAGMRLPIINAQTGEVHEAEVFVAAMGASSFTYAEALHSQELRCWLSAHVNTYEFLGGVPRVTVPDNLKAGVTKPSFYDPEINRSYQDLAEYYGIVVIPTRVRKPRDKSKVENAVQQVERWVLAPLRNQRFFSLSEANREIRERLIWLNDLRSGASRSARAARRPARCHLDHRRVAAPSRDLAHVRRRTNYRRCRPRPAAAQLAPHQATGRVHEKNPIQLDRRKHLVKMTTSRVPSLRSDRSASIGKRDRLPSEHPLAIVGICSGSCTGS